MHQRIASLVVRYGMPFECLRENKLKKHNDSEIQSSHCCCGDNMEVLWQVSWNYLCLIVLFYSISTLLEPINYLIAWENWIHGIKCSSSNDKCKIKSSLEVEELTKGTHILHPRASCGKSIVSILRKLTMLTELHCIKRSRWYCCIIQVIILIV